MRAADPATLDLVTCPNCAETAEVLERFDLGGLPHVRVHCVRRHRYLMPAAGVPGALVPTPAAHVPAQATRSATRPTGELAANPRTG